MWLHRPDAISSLRLSASFCRHKKPHKSISSLVPSYRRRQTALLLSIVTGINPSLFFAVDARHGIVCFHEFFTSPRIHHHGYKFTSLLLPDRARCGRCFFHDVRVGAIWWIFTLRLLIQRGFGKFLYKTSWQAMRVSSPTSVTLVTMGLSCSPGP